MARLSRQQSASCLISARLAVAICARLLARSALYEGVHFSIRQFLGSGVLVLVSYFLVFFLELVFYRLGGVHAAMKMQEHHEEQAELVARLLRHQSASCLMSARYRRIGCHNLC